MNFRSFTNFLEFPDLFEIQKVLYCVSMTSSLRQQVNGLVQVNSDLWVPSVSD